MLQIYQWKISRLIKKIKSLQSSRVNTQPSDQMLKKEILYYFELAAIYKKLKNNTKIPHAPIMEISCYRAAALLDDSSAHYKLGQIFLDEARFRQNLQREGVFQSEANLKRCYQLYEEAHAHLQAADKMGNIAAKRLRGLCFINGWGTDIDKEAGFELIVSSIEQEGSWDKVPQIFAAMGLNKPEFFAAIMQRRKGTTP
ncbi:MAG: hypothetical protein Q8M40_08590 [Legionella sp.]|nr:hypothetical protein [Legionella sp.]